MEPGVCGRHGLWNDRRGITALEYAIMAGVIAAAITYGVTLETKSIAETWQVVVNAFPPN